MAFKMKDLSVIAYSNGFTLWNYTTVDPADTVNGEGYFNEASEVLRRNDLILANVDAEAASPDFDQFLVTAVGDGSVVVRSLFATAEQPAESPAS